MAESQIDIAMAEAASNRLGVEDFFEIKETREGEVKIGKFIPKRMGDYILGQMPCKTLKANDRIYRYVDGVYREDGEPTIRAICRDLLGEHYSNKRLSEVIGYIKATTYIDNQPDTSILNLKNGILNPFTMELMPHNPEKFTIIRIPIEYNPSAGCQVWNQKLREKCDEKTIIFLQEMFGYCFMPGQPLETAFLFYGPKRTMKSTILYILNQMLGENNVTAMSLQSLTDDPFSSAYLFGKKANICADIDSAALRSTGKFMQITGGDPITAGKKHEHHMTFYPESKLIFSCNIIPGTSNKDMAFYRRWKIVEFKNQTNIDDIDIKMKEKLSEELPGILNWALNGLKRLINNGKFSYWLSEDDVKDLYERSSDSINSYIYCNISMEEDESMLKKRLVYADYANYCLKNRLFRHNPIRFGREFLASTGCGTSKVDGIPAYVGVSFRNTKRIGGLEDYV